MDTYQEPVEDMSAAPATEDITGMTNPVVPVKEKSWRNLWGLLGGRRHKKSRAHTKKTKGGRKSTRRVRSGRKSNRA
jgi:hypothetical protein